MRQTDDKSDDARAANNDDYAEDESPNQPADTESDTMTQRRSITGAQIEEGNEVTIDVTEDGWEDVEATARVKHVTDAGRNDDVMCEVEVHAVNEDWDHYETLDYLPAAADGWVFGVIAADAEVYVEVDEDSINLDNEDEEKELVTDGGQPVETDADSTTEIPTPSYDLSIITTDRDRDNGVRYLGLIENNARVNLIADEYGVRDEDLTRVLFALGASLDHDVREDETVVDRDDGYVITADTGHRHVVKETVSREISDENALEGELVLADEFSVDTDELEEERLISHYRDQLVLAVLETMRRLDTSDHNYPAGYPLVILSDG